ncbi:head-tail connector protein [Aminobacter sp. BE322]|uniref:head-tail connector protein n=1 Tax=unclassified Aminobacter TaxID=2644704 RepID=UPI003D22DA7F
MWDRIERVDQPSAEALTLAEVKSHGIVDGSDDDAFLTRCIKAARQIVEGPEGAGLGIMAASWKLSLDRFPRDEIRIPMGPVLSVDKIEFVDPAGGDQTVAPAAYEWRRGFLDARIRPAVGASWPATRDRLDAVTVTFKAGYPGTDGATPNLAMVPEALRHAMLMLIAHWTANRETSVVGAVPAEVLFGFDAILNQFRVGRVA